MDMWASMKFWSIGKNFMLVSQPDCVFDESRDPQTFP